MPKRREIPNSARFAYATERAYVLLLDMGFDRFPISPWAIIEQYSDKIICLPWSEARSILHTDDPFHLHQLHAEARTMKPRDNNKYMIIYEDVLVTNLERILWTIMHELGHIFLRHLDDFNATALDRGGLTKTEYGVLEIEAHYFATEAFMPTAVLKRFSGAKSEEIRLLCGVSSKAAEKKHKNVYVNDYHPDTKYDEKLFRNFSHFLIWNLDEALYAGICRLYGKSGYKRYNSICRKCPVCFSYITEPTAIHCAYCGNELEPNIIVKNHIERKHEEVRIFAAPGTLHFEFNIRPIDASEYRHYQGLEYCPICLNHNFSTGAQYCRICGHPLFNYCIAENKPVPVHARYCQDCGSETTFRKGYLLTEQRLRHLADCVTHPAFNNDWFEYPYWDFIKLRVSGRSDMELHSALLYSVAYTDDDDNMFVFAGNQNTAALIFKDRYKLLEIANNNDSARHSIMEVYCIDDI